MTELDTLVDTYFDVKAKIHKGFGYTPDWAETPMDDKRQYPWMLVGGNAGFVVYSPEPLTKESVEAGKKIYGGPVYAQRFLPKWVYRTETHVMISVDTRVDGNKFLMIFDAAKECTDDTLRETYAKKWLSP